MEMFPTATTANVAASKPQVAVLPIGSFEQHGSFLPLATDSIVATAIASAVATRYNVLLLPPITISCSHEHAAWPGTVSISHTALSAIIADIRTSLNGSGITKLILINGHGGNYVLSNIVQTANAAEPRSMSLFPTRTDWDAARAAAHLDTDAHHDMHAGEVEVSILLHVQPELVGSAYRDGDHAADDRSMLLVEGMRAYTTTGIIGKPSAGTAEKGILLLASLVASFQQHFNLLQAR
ncbi:creatininase family protein [Dactylosporangium sp. CS-047395]|uniref:creatininase family protein n=1 Tax=Dactylosporangium sp. CS-047395 TaxID=3239936 RepID=UPI003D8DB8CB